jgi:hypothetical protein
MLVSVLALLFFKGVLYWGYLIVVAVVGVASAVARLRKGVSSVDRHSMDEGLLY